MDKRYFRIRGRREAPPMRRGDPLPRRGGYQSDPQDDDWDDDWDDGWDDDWDDEYPGRSAGSWAITALMSFYKVLVVLSVVVVVVFVGFHIFVKTPEQEALVPPSQTGDEAGAGDGLVPDGVGEGMELRKGVYNIFLAATDKGGTRTDTMMVMSYDTEKQTVGVISVPRDTLVARERGNPHLVYGPGGLEQRIADVSEMLGVPIHYYIKVDIKGFITLVDYLGGIDFYVPCDMNYDDPVQDLHIHFKKGQQHLTGQQAMEVTRFRKNNDGSGYSDIGRTQTQQAVLVALAKKALSLGSLTKINGFVEFFSKNVDTNLSLNNMLYFASQGINLDPSTGVETATLEGRGDGVYHGVTYCYELDPQKTLETVNRLINPYTKPLTLDNMNIAKAQSYR